MRYNARGLCRKTWIAMKTIEKTAPLPPAGLLRRLASMLYDTLLLTAVLFIAAFLFVGLTHAVRPAVIKPIFQLYLLLVTGGYFVWFWLHGGQTLAMKTWRLRLVNTAGKALTPRQAIFRFFLAVAGIGLAGIGIAWAVVDRDKQFLHDRLAGTRIVTG